MREPYITSLAALEALYGQPAAASVQKETDHLHPHYAAWLAASPLCLLATQGPRGIDISPRGDEPGFVQVRDAHTLLLPDRRGNNRIDSLRNLIADPRVGLIFLIPGVEETLRIKGRARISVDPALLASLAVDGKAPRCVLEIAVDSVFFQCGRALLRSHLWDPARHLVRASLPSLGTILRDLSQGTFDGASYDRDLPERLKTTLY